MLIIIGISSLSKKSSSSSLGSFLIGFNILLSLAELPQVQSSNFFSLSNLVIVVLNFGLELSGQVRHSILVLLVLSGLEIKLLEMALSLVEGLHGLTSLCLDGSKFKFKLTPC